MEQQRQMFEHLIASKPRREGRMATAATLVSLLFHGAVVAGLVWATMAVGQETEEQEEQVTLFQLPEEEPIPPPPPPPPPPAQVEVVAPAEALEDVPRGFQTLAMPTVILPDIPPPSSFATIEADFSGEGVEGGKAAGKAVEGQGETDVYAGPVVTPYTVAPELKNRDEVQRALSRYYPPLLRDAGIGGTVLVWLLIDEEGQVRKYQVKESSGHTALDDAALKVADIMRFSPALNRDRKVPVWVALPITFTVR
ncbi:MAG TPA: TonB family protein [Longimicrobiales bacterium]